jgi:hypothetical protein
MKTKLTKDELYLCTVCKNVKKDTRRPINRYTIGQLLSQNNKSVDNTVQILVKTNFLKRVGDGNDITITQQGISLVEALGFKID